MSEETIVDILAEMFDFSDKRIEEGRDHAMTSESVGLIVHQLAKRFEAAWKRESAGNAAAVREAMNQVLFYAQYGIQYASLNPGDKECGGYLKKIENIARSALKFNESEVAR